ncbi:A24 family peptidase [uncultured Salinisphaera sp.]|uniref:prepilin peptidase n=1 Tax=uncultured Salinisphaera sp. TaxID=359372 RepID=UPI0032B23B9D|tara:strand:+ start:2415 stop:3308 length:894 start_codon:yes stop_codon:yes gene_type:complete
MAAWFSALPPWFVVLALGLIALALGSFINVVIVRLPRMMEARWAAELADATGDLHAAPVDAGLSLAFPGSHCPHCRTPIRYRHNLPLIGYLLLGGRCASCRARISPLYPLVELTSLAVACVALARFGFTPAALAAYVLSAYLLVLAVIDARTQLLPDVLTLSLLWLGLLASVAGGPGHTLTGVTPRDAILGAAAGYGILWAVFQGFAALTGKHGMGYGDFKLLAALGAWLGWQALPMVVIIASTGGALVGGALLATGRMQRDTPMPFGPWLAVAGWLVLIAGDTIGAVYLRATGWAP